MEKETAKAMIDWLQIEYGHQFDFKKVEAPIELMLKNHRRKVLEEAKHNKT